MAAASDGSFMVAWDAHDFVNPTNSLDIYARHFSSAGVGGTTLHVNSHLYGDQYAPRLSATGIDYMIVWTSLGQDGSRERRVRTVGRSSNTVNVPQRRIRILLRDPLISRKARVVASRQ